MSKCPRTSLTRTAMTTKTAIASAACRWCSPLPEVLSHLHSLARLLYEARILPAPPIHRPGDGPGNLESRLAVVGAPEIRRPARLRSRARTFPETGLHRQATVRDVLSSLTDEQIASRRTRTEPGWPQEEDFGSRNVSASSSTRNGSTGSMPNVT